ncbi:hypothetical protein GW17_00013595 [Ensete ventricosum]|nr:hypothetical protein GW17_00013595 [Ensete ventricosum]
MLNFLGSTNVVPEASYERRQQRGAFGGRKRRSDDCSKKSRGCFISLRLRKKMLVTLTNHEWLRVAATTGDQWVCVGVLRQPKAVADGQRQ